MGAPPVTPSGRTPLFSGIVLMLTKRCPVRCSCCAVDCTPQSRSEFSLEAAKALVNAASARDLPIARKLSITGGEPFLDLNRLVELIRFARLRRFDVNTVTSAFWARSTRDADKLITALKTAGLAKLIVSTDTFHTERVPVTRVECAVRACRDAGLECSIQVIETPDHPSADTARQIDPELLSCVEVQAVRCAPAGRAKTFARQTFEWRPLDGIDRRGCNLAVTATPTGRLYPCCSPLALEGAPSLGDLSVRDLAAVLRAAVADPFWHLLRAYGPTFFADLLARWDRMPSGPFVGPCGLCAAIFSRGDLRRLIREASRHLVAQPSGGPAGHDYQRSA
jgi:hypothetical protein